MDVTYHNFGSTFTRYKPNGSVYNTFSWTFYSKGKTFSEETKESVDTGKFIPGIFRVNPYSVSRCALTSTDQPETVEFALGDGGATSPYTEKHVLTGPLAADVLLIDELIDQADITKLDFGNAPEYTLQKAYAKVGQSDLSLGVELGELKETVEMIKSPLKSLRDFFIADRGRNMDILRRLLRKDPQFRRDDKRLGLAAGSTAANTWLEFRYGFRPLVSSITEIAQYMEKKRDKLFQPNRIRTAKATREWKVTSTDRKPGQSMIVGSLAHRIQQDDDFRVISNVYYKMHLEQSLSGELGLSPAYFPEVMWDLTKLSFVVGWLFSIGPWLGSFRVKPAISILGSTTSRKLVRSIKIQPEYQISTSGLWTPIGNGELSLDAYNRSVNDELPATPLFLGTQRLDILKSIDLSTLLVQPLLRALKKK
jgi:hypothetical protein